MVWCGQRRLKEGRVEALHAAEIYEELGAVADLERCRKSLHNMEEELNSEFLQIWRFLARINFPFQEPKYSTDCFFFFFSFFGLMWGMTFETDNALYDAWRKCSYALVCRFRVGLASGIGFSTDCFVELFKFRTPSSLKSQKPYPLSPPSLAFTAVFLLENILSFVPLHVLFYICCPIAFH